MLGFSFVEILFLAILALIVIGPKQLPEVARTIGRFLNDLKRSTESFKDEFKIKMDDDFETRRKEASAQLLKQQEAIRKKIEAEGIPVAEEDRQMSLPINDSQKKENS